MAKLAPYRKKRDFSTTAEPRGTAKSTSGNSFVIQKHAARRLHYDLRLELDGVMRSWAVTRGPSLVTGEKRLAVRVEDHPLDYATFEGTIPKGQYGGGTVLVWDRGTWLPSADPRKGLAKGHLEFELHGEKLTGAWDLVRMHGKKDEKRENWLLIKREDSAARPANATDILEERPESVATDRTIEDIAAAPTAPKPASKACRAKAKPAASTLPAFIEPMLATLAAKPPAARGWIHEIKFDGYRLQARIAAGRVTLLTRSGLDWTRKFGTNVTDALKALAVDTAIIDGEIVVETRAGASDFSALQA
ncbi:MAG: DNA polymerase ligase N-terminal domain-containing protein, partial [Acidiphilium sp.]|nr:DNA polymerase ligase N-terminal domain-containing protein [Acidiphilium sp.]